MMTMSATNGQHATKPPTNATVNHYAQVPTFASSAHPSGGSVPTEFTSIDANHSKVAQVGMPVISSVDHAGKIVTYYNPSMYSIPSPVLIPAAAGSSAHLSANAYGRLPGAIATGTFVPDLLSLEMQAMHADIASSLTTIATPDGTLTGTNVYIRNLAPETTDDNLRDWFKGYGEIVSVKAIVDLSTGRCKGYGFVLFQHEGSAKSAIKDLGDRMQLSLAKESFNTRLKKLQDPSTSNVYMSNLPLSITEQGLQDLLKEFGEVVSCRVLRDVHGNSRGVGFARMASREIAGEVILHLNKIVLDGGSVPLQVRFADSIEQKKLKAHIFKRNPVTGFDSSGALHSHHHHQSQAQQGLVAMGGVANTVVSSVNVGFNSLSTTSAGSPTSLPFMATGVPANLNSSGSLSAANMYGRNMHPHHHPHHPHHHQAGLVTMPGYGDMSAAHMYHGYAQQSAASSFHHHHSQHLMQHQQPSYGHTSTLSQGIYGNSAYGAVASTAAQAARGQVMAATPTPAGAAAATGRMLGNSPASAMSAISLASGYGSGRSFPVAKNGNIETATAAGVPSPLHPGAQSFVRTVNGTGASQWNGQYVQNPGKGMRRQNGRQNNPVKDHHQVSDSEGTVSAIQKVDGPDGTAATSDVIEGLSAASEQSIPSTNGNTGDKSAKVEQLIAAVSGLRIN